MYEYAFSRVELLSILDIKLFFLSKALEQHVDNPRDRPLKGVTWLSVPKMSLTPFHVGRIQVNNSKLAVGFFFRILRALVSVAVNIIIL